MNYYVFTWELSTDASYNGCMVPEVDWISSKLCKKRWETGFDNDNNLGSIWLGDAILGMTETDCVR